jgi:hypothetical protein
MTAPSTQKHIDIEDIVQNLILLKDGGCALVLQVGAVNFNLLSEEEQDAIIFAYAALLNSLTFPAQILIRSQKKDITTYLKVLSSQEKKQSNPIYRKRLTQYRQFVETLVKERQVLDKRCYIIIPFQRIELGLSTSSIISNKKTESLPFDKTYIIEKALAALEPKRDHLIRQFGRVGLSARQLSTQQLIELFYSIYNPGSNSFSAEAAASVTSPLVEGPK